MEFEITPYIGAGPITFGLTREEVRQRLGSPAEPFMKSPSSESPTDAFDALGIHVHYDSNERCKAVEVVRSLTKPTFRGQEVLGRPFTEVERWLRTLDPDLRSDSNGLTSLKFGFGLYAPAVTHDPQTPVEGVIVFKRDYYG